MKSLKELLYKVPIEAIVGKTDLAITSLCFDSREVKKNMLFFALKGVSFDGHQFIDIAIKKGASVIVCEILPELFNDAVVYVQVANAHIALGIIAANFFDNPSSHLKLIGVTGTNGKTTIATLLFSLFKEQGHASGLLSTVAVRYNNFSEQATHTTPDPIQINAYLKKMLAEGVTHCFMEVSSHGIAQNRISGLYFSGGIFTNLTHDHLDYHKNFDNYRNIKKVFFDQLPKEAFALTNIDDKNGRFMLQNTKAKKYTYALSQYADFNVKILESQLSGMLLKLDQQEVWTTLVGKFNALNLTAVFSASKLLGIETLEVLKQISRLKSVPGRFQLLHSNDAITVIIDYAHTPDALQNTLKTINEIRTKNETLITVVGCGGNRDRAKRPLMGKAAAAGSDKVIFTSDNPRNENPGVIIEEMIEGVSPENYKKVLKVTLREEAIAVAKQMCQKGDIVLIAGKGHEDYQEIEGKRIPFDDYLIAQKIFLNQA